MTLGLWRWAVICFMGLLLTLTVILSGCGEDAPHEPAQGQSRWLDDLRYGDVHAVQDSLDNILNWGSAELPTLIELLDSDRPEDVDAALGALCFMGASAESASQALLRLGKEVGYERLLVETLSEIGPKARDALPFLLALRQEAEDRIAESAGNPDRRSSFDACLMLAVVEDAIAAIRRSPPWADAEDSNLGSRRLSFWRAGLYDGYLKKAAEVRAGVALLPPEIAVSRLLTFARFVTCVELRCGEHGWRPSSREVAAVVATFGAAALPAIERALDAPADQALHVAALRVLSLLDCDWGPVLPRVLRFLESGSHQEKRAALDALASIGEKASSALPALLTSLGSDDPDLFAGAIEVLVVMPESAGAALPIIAEHLQNPDAPKRRFFYLPNRARAALSWLRDGTDGLLDLLEDPDPNDCFAAWYLLESHTGTAAAKLALYVAALEQGHPRLQGVVVAGLIGLGELGQKYLVDAAEKDPSLVALIVNRDGYPLALWSGEEIPRKDVRVQDYGTLRPVLMAALESPDIDTRRYACAALRGLKQFESADVERVVQLLRDPDPWVAREAVATLGFMNVRPSVAVRPLTAALEYRYPGDETHRGGAKYGVAGAAAAALMTIGEPALPAIPSLLRRLHAIDSDDSHSYANSYTGTRVRINEALIGLCAISREARELVAREAGSRHDDFREDVYRVLASTVTHEGDIWEWVLSALEDPGYWVRRTVAHALGERAEEEVWIATELERIATTGHPTEGRVAVISALKTYRWVPLLVGLLDASAPAIREAAAKSLGIVGLGARRALPRLRILLNDPDEGVRGCAGWAIEEILTCKAGWVHSR